MTKREINAPYIWAISLIAACGGFLFGYDWVVIGGAKPFYEIYFAISDPLVSGFVMGSALIGCLSGAVFAGLIADRYGRKPSLVMAATLFAVSAVGTALADSIDAFIGFRIIGGLGIGLASTVSPVYIAEISPAERRGKLVAVNQLAIVLGILSAQITNLLIAETAPAGASAQYILQSWNGQTGWRYMFAAEVVPAALFFLLMLAAPESPRWLVKAQQPERARRVLGKMGSAPYAARTLADILASYAGGGHRRETAATLKGAEFREIRPIVLIGLVLAVFQQWCGINVIFNYAQEVFASAGFDIDDTLRSIVATGLVNLVFTLLALPLVERVGRRKLMLAGALGLAAIYSLMAGAYALGLSGAPLLVLVLCAIALYAATLAPVTWVLLSEIFPNRVRSAAMAISTFALWSASLSLTLTFPILNSALGASGTFFIYALICLAGFTFIYRRVPETRSLSLEDIERILFAGPRAHH